ncbi:AdoMet dependent proline di-methyltransferase-domain-containing protein [Radiomyces spectabilis]|uniref:AdoMet dependent proline di-methyltransferase-domain-containing protein n=1 Tax=Radiomyces spectabilis TaxID=64574 RepID=UPI00221E8698|nr:AdoMet dependent proline di-methyltransferase-domain-containing protein [Radiomyces spectabilis]KAI8373189.1 AdoMet dependent proline di-methyltransferase-domain-containing protein [Radiomyces spectabilis]
MTWYTSAGRMTLVNIRKRETIMRKESDLLFSDHSNFFTMSNDANDTSVVPSMNEPDWYNNAQKYWTNVDATVDGVLGGFESVDPIDVKGSLSFVNEFVHGGRHGTVLKPPVITNGYACDCGAGIGRVTKNFLLKVPFQKVDLVEQAPNFVQQAKDEYLAAEIKQGLIGEIYSQGLQDFVPEQGKYDLIWCQWVLGHLTDEHLVAFFKRCIKGLKPNGLIGVKENNSSKGYLLDEEDSSVTRPNTAFKKIFKEAGLEVVKEGIQRGLPAGLFAVRMYMLKPIAE